MSHSMMFTIGLLSIFGTTFLGGVIPLFIPHARENRLKLFVSLGAGLLIGMSFLHMLPEASEISPHTFGAWFLLGFVLLLVLERFVMVHPCEEHGCDYHTVGIAAFAGLTTHGVIEGFAFASSLYVSKLSLLVLIAILSHTLPQGFALTSILRLAGKTRNEVIVFALGVSLSGPLGMLIANTILTHGQMTESVGALLSISAGTFVYVAACDLLPELHRNTDEKFKRLAAFFAGLVIAYISGQLLGDHHH